MKINYKEPYWLKFNWDISNHHENQYVTNFDKIENMKSYDDMVDQMDEVGIDMSK